MSHPHFPAPRLLAAALLTVLGCSVLQAQTTINWTTTSPDGNTGNWSDTSKWSGGTVPDGNFNASFGAYANPRTITVDNAAYTINKLTILPRTSGFAAQGFTLNSSGGGSLRIGAGGMDIDNGSTVAFNVAVELTANQTWTGLTNSPSGSANFTQPISGAFGITRVGQNGGTFTFSGANTFSGGYTNTSGTTRIGVDSVVTGGSLTSSALGTGTIMMNGGILSSNGGTARTIFNAVNFGATSTIGNASDNGVLTFSSTGLNTPSAVNLSATTNGTYRIINVNSTVNMNTAIGETGATGLGLIVGGSSILNLNAGKTFTGDSLVQGSATLNFGTATAQAGNAIAFGGTLQATGASRMVTGFVGAEGGEIRISSSDNLIGRSGQVAAFRGARVSTSGSIADLNSVLNPNSSVNLALTANSSTAFDQSALGNGRAGLVAGTTGTVTYTGTLTAGNDNNFRIGGGLGTLSLPNSTATGSSGLIVQGGGTANISGNQTYTGATTINSNLTLSGANGALSGTSGIAVNNSTLLIDNGTNSNNRLNDSAAITLNRGTFQVTTPAGNGAVSEAIGNLNFGGGIGTVTFSNTPTGGSRIYTTPEVVRQNNALGFIRGDSFGPATSGGNLTNRNALVVTNAPTGINLVGGGGSTATNRSIIPWMLGGGAANSNGASFVTYEATTGALRVLDTATEFVTSLGAAAATDNVRVSLTSSATILSDTRTVNSFIINGNNNLGGVTATIATGQTLTVTSGAIHLNNSQSQPLTLTGGTIAFGSAPGIITSNGNGFLHTLGSTITGSAGVSFYALNSSPLSITGVNTFSGGVTVGSIGSALVAFSNDNQFGAASNVVTHAGGTLRFFGSGAASATRNYSLLGDVGDNTFDLNSSSAANYTIGTVSGAGRLRLVTSAAAANSLTLANANTYTGGTVVDSGILIVSNNSGLGTGSLAVNNGSVNFTSAAPTIGALFSSAGTGANTVITLGNANISSTALTLGANNDSGIYAGTIAESAAGRGSLIKAGTGTQILTNFHSFTGGTTVNAGTLTVAGGLSTSGNVTVNTGATLDGNGRAGATTLSGGTLGGTLNLTTLSSTGGTIAAGASPVVTGAATFSSGTTFVNGTLTAGSLIVSGGTTRGSGTINSSATVTGTLAGNLTINGTTTVNSGGVLAPGNSVGVINTGSVTFNSSSSFAFEMNIAGPDSVTADLINVTGNLSLFDSPTLSISNLGTNQPLTLGTVITLINYTGTWNGGFFNGFADGSTFSLFNNQFRIDYGSGTNSAVTFEVVPEPSTALLLVGGASLLLALRRRRDGARA